MTADAKMSLKRYDLFGCDYETVNPFNEDSAQWHLKWAKQVKGPLLGLACGTGRLLCRLAEAGHDITGLDLSATMLNQARSHVRSLPADVQTRITLAQADMADFTFEQKFGLVFIADNSFRELPTRAHLSQCLKCIRRHLTNDGKLLITERNPLRHSRTPRRWDWTPPIAFAATDETVSRRGEVALSDDGRQIVGKFEYKTVHPDGSETVVECPFDGPVLQEAEYITLLTDAGFSTEVFYDFGDKDTIDNSDSLCLVCSSN